MSSKFHKELTGTGLHAPGYMESGVGPGPVGVGKYWFDITEGKMVLKIRDEANGAWRAVSGAYFSDTDPGVVGAGRLWLDSSLGTGAYILKIRNVNDNGWAIITSSFVSDGTNTVTAAELKTEVTYGPTHRADLTVHRLINDSVLSSTGLWSSQKTHLSIKEACPIGTVLMFAGSSAPSSDYYACTGSGLSTSTFSVLFSIIGYTYGGSGVTFNIPNLGNQFIRGAGGVRGNVGTLQAQDVQSHTHPIQVYGFERTNQNNVDRVISAGGGSYTRNTDNNIGSETRPANIALAYWIKALNNGFNN